MVSLPKRIAPYDGLMKLAYSATVHRFLLSVLTRYIRSVKPPFLLESLGLRGNLAVEQTACHGDQHQGGIGRDFGVGGRCGRNRPGRRHGRSGRCGESTTFMLSAPSI